MVRGDGMDRDYRVSVREADVLVLVAAGLSNQQIARRLGIASQTVARHVSLLLARVGAPNRAALVARAYCAGLLQHSTWPPMVTAPSAAGALAPPDRHSALAQQVPEGADAHELLG